MAFARVLVGKYAGRVLEFPDGVAAELIALGRAEPAEPDLDPIETATARAGSTSDPVRVLARAPGRPRKGAKR